MRNTANLSLSLFDGPDMLSRTAINRNTEDIDAAIGAQAQAAAKLQTELGQKAPAIQYGTADVTAGSASSYPEGTLYVVIE